MACFWQCLPKDKGNTVFLTTVTEVDEFCVWPQDHTPLLVRLLCELQLSVCVQGVQQLHFCAPLTVCYVFQNLFCFPRDHVAVNSEHLQFSKIICKQPEDQTRCQVPLMTCLSISSQCCCEKGKNVHITSIAFTQLLIGLHLNQITMSSNYRDKPHRMCQTYYTSQFPLVWLRRHCLLPLPRIMGVYPSAYFQPETSS